MLPISHFPLPIAPNQYHRLRIPMTLSRVQWDKRSAYRMEVLLLRFSASLNKAELEQCQQLQSELAVYSFCKQSQKHGLKCSNTASGSVFF